MKANTALDALADRFGILSVFRDLSGKEQPTSRETKLALLRANGIQLDNDAMILDELARLRAIDSARILPREIVVVSAEEHRLDIAAGSQWQLQREGEPGVAAEGRSKGSVQLPPLASGIHDFTIRTGKIDEVVHIIAAPRTAPSVWHVSGRDRLWGVNAALYGLSSERGSGVGDFEDLAGVTEALAGQGADFFGINPVHNIGWSDTRTISPYSPSHRGFLNTTHIAVDRIAGLRNSSAALALLDDLKSAVDNVHCSNTIDYAGHGSRHRRLLKSLFSLFLSEAEPQAMAGFEAFCEEQGDALQRFALFETLSETHGPDWQDWPSEFQSPARTGTAQFAALADKGLVFHSWLQWLAGTQLAHAQDRASRSGMSLGLYLDLAVGPRRGGAEAWCESNSVAKGVSIGAPPDHLSPAGQNWNLAAFSPPKLAAGKYRALRDILARTMRYCSVLRIDHVLGMNRSYWIPDDGSPGGYIRQPFQALLAIVTIEAERAGTVVVGEDLGLVPEGFRETMNERNIYSYSVLQYEKDENRQFRQLKDLRTKSLACFGTHDTPTIKGFWKCRDIDWWQKLGWIDDEQAETARAERVKEIAALYSLEQKTGTADHRSFDELSRRVHSALAQSSVAMVSVQLDDILGETEAQNLPGTVDEHPNWQRRCSVPIELLGRNQSLASIGRLMMDSSRSGQRGIQEENAK